MRSRSSVALLGITMICCLLLTACGGGGSNSGGGGGSSNPPVISTSSLPGGTVGTAYSATLSATSGTPPYSWSITSGALPAGLTLNSAGAITGTPTTPVQSSFTVQVTDSKSLTASASLKIIIAGVVQVTTSSLPNGTVTVPYNAALAASGGVGPYTWSIAGGALPAGLTLSSAGAITGTPTAAGTSNFTVQATDSESPGVSATANLSITVVNPLQITTASLPNGAVNVPYSATVAATGGIPPYTWSIASGNLPNGLMLDTNNGVISGTPSASGTFNFTVQVADSQSPAGTTTKDFSITIAQVLVNNTILPSGIQTVPYSATLTASGGTSPYTWCVQEVGGNCDNGLGTLPEGLTLSSAGVISGTPTLKADTKNFIVQVTDSSSPALTATAALTITINTSMTNGALKGDYGFTFNGFSGSNSSFVFLTGRFTADGTGNVTNGLLDENVASGPVNAVFTGTYTIQPNGLGSMVITLAGGKGSFNFSLAVESTSSKATHGTMVLNGSGIQTSGSGEFKTQVTGVTLDQLVGNFGSGFFGIDTSNMRLRLAGAGAYVISSSSGSFVLNGNADVNDGGTLTTFTTTSLAMSLDSTTGRGTVVLTISSKLTHWAFYIISADEIAFIPLDPIGASPPFIGLQSMLRQATSSFDKTYLKGVSVFAAQGLGENSGQPAGDVVAGLLSADGLGNANSSLDENNGGTVTQQQTASGTYSIAANGKVTLGGGFGAEAPILYLVNLNQAFVLGTGSTVAFGSLEPQSGAPFTNLSYIGSTWGGTVSPVDAGVGNTAGWFFPDGNGTFIGAYCNGLGCPPAQEINVSGTYQIDNTGRAVVMSGGNQIAVFYVVSPTKIALLPLPSSPSDTNPALAVFSSN